MPPDASGRLASAAAVASSDTDLDRSGGPVAHLVRVGASSTAFTSMLGGLLAACSERAPETRFQPVLCPSPVLALEEVAARRLDAAILEDLAAPAGLSSAPLGAIRYLAAVPDGGRLSRAEELSVAELEAHPLALALDGGGTDVVTRLWRVAAEGAVTVVPQDASGRRAPVGVALRPLRDVPARPLSLVWSDEVEGATAEAVALLRVCADAPPPTRSRDRPAV